jgi:hypothetical protein
MQGWRRFIKFSILFSSCDSATFSGNGFDFIKTKTSFSIRWWIGCPESLAEKMPWKCLPNKFSFFLF